jgi:hypothetical protein
MTPFKFLALKSIKLYQSILSFDHSFWGKKIGYRICIHSPSCSEYTYQAIEKFGVIPGSVMGFFRILRCNPFGRGGYDPLPDKFMIRGNYERGEHIH